MESNEKFVRYIAIIALLIAVVGVSVGFAALTNTVNIKAGAEVRYPNPDSVAVLSTDDDSSQQGTVTPTTTGGATGDNASLGTDTIQNMKAHFTAPGQSVTYSFYAYNGSSFISYLNSVVFGAKTCTPAQTNGGTQSYVTAACADISMSITAGTGAGAATFTTDNTNVTGHSVAAGGSEPIVVTITYATGGAVADGDFDVDFGTTVLTYSTVD